MNTKFFNLSLRIAGSYKQQRPCPLEFAHFTLQIVNLLFEPCAIVFLLCQSLLQFGDALASKRLPCTCRLGRRRRGSWAW